MNNKEWKPHKLDELGSVGRGKSRHRPRNAAHLYGGPYPFFQTGDIKAAGFHLTEFTQTYSEDGLAQSKLWEPGTLCITIAANIAENAILGVKGCFPDSVVGFIPDPKKADVRFVKYYLDTLKLQMQSISRGTTQDNLSVDKLLSFDFNTPTLKTQQRIADILATYDELIENSQRRIKILESMARGLYREWFVHFRFPGHEGHPRVASALGEIPEGWSVVKFGDLYNTGSGGTPSRARPEYFMEGSIAWVKSQELLDGFVLSTEERITERAILESSAKVFPANTVLVALYGATIGKLAILSQAAATNQACCAVLSKLNSYGREFAYLTLLVNREKIIGMRLGAAQQNISQVLLRNFECLKPQDELVHRFSKVTAPFFDGILTLQRQIENIRRTRDLLLPRLLSGQIEVEAT
ncbi:restriction endonuclease subunit S [Rhodoferax lacus]|uniref:Restriction endonuclease subunit S n=1 Tax=Rhodoferax lacus TaxID=2184758 RepID=A0A3E1RCM8_9BURK|nr:restriction endonuclease subunit S [Rhodoferax lacus]RFO96782.1 restriction endonuclease subunit S [Rhodoferax lacus]